MRPAGRRAVKVGLLVLCVLAVGVLVSRGADRPADPTLLPAAGGRTPVEGFGEVGFRIEGADTAAAARCALLAESVKQKGQGLMNRRDLAGYDGMVFAFDEDTTTQFYMKDTPLPLSIAWFDADGRFVSAADMTPCLDQPDCPLYDAGRPYRYALEVPKGALPGLGVGPGARLVLTPTCT